MSAEWDALDAAIQAYATGPDDDGDARMAGGLVVRWTMTAEVALADSADNVGVCTSKRGNFIEALGLTKIQEAHWLAAWTDD